MKNLNLVDSNFIRLHRRFNNKNQEIIDYLEPLSSNFVVRSNNYQSDIFRLHKQYNKNNELRLDYTIEPLYKMNKSSFIKVLALRIFNEIKNVINVRTRSREA